MTWGNQDSGRDSGLVQDQRNVQPIEAIRGAFAAILERCRDMGTSQVQNQLSNVGQIHALKRCLIFGAAFAAFIESGDIVGREREKERKREREKERKREREKERKREREKERKREREKERKRERVSERERERKKRCRGKVHHSGPRNFETHPHRIS